MKLPADHREILLCAALTMNIAQIELQNELFSHQGALAPEQQPPFANTPAQLGHPA
jgi:hypothetical protein